jgi:cysteine synthase
MVLLVYEQALEMIGNTPHVRVKSRIPNLAIYVKLEGCNPTGSIKDRTCIRLIRDVLERGKLKPGMCLLDASSGNLGCSLAYYSRLFGYQACVVSSSKLTASKKDFMEFYGAKVLMVGNFTIEGNHFCHEMTRETPHKYCFLDQLHNWNNPRAHYETTGPEVLEAFPDLSVLVGSLGSGGSLLGTAQHIKERAPQVKVVAVQAAIGTRLPGTASLSDGDYVTPFIEMGFQEKLFDHTYKVSEVEATTAALRLRDQGIFCGLQTGGVFSAAEQIAENQHILGKVVVLSGDSGWKNMDKLLLTNMGFSV